MVVPDVFGKTASAALSTEAAHYNGFVAIPSPAPIWESYAGMQCAAAEQIPRSRYAPHGNTDCRRKLTFENDAPTARDAF
jgi:hypothetical protein